MLNSGKKCTKVARGREPGEPYFTDGFVDVAASRDPKPFFLHATLKINFDPRFVSSPTASNLSPYLTDGVQGFRL